MMSVALVSYFCAWCGETAAREAGQIKRSLLAGMELYCGRQCSGEARRVCRTDAQKRALKADYDRQRRAVIGDRIRAEKRAAYHAAIAADPQAMRAKERDQRQRRMPSHLEYCRRPEYRKWKADYDRKYLARKGFGEFSEAAIILNDLCSEIASRSSFYDRAIDKGTLNKHQQRRRDYERQTDRR